MFIKGFYRTFFSLAFACFALATMRVAQADDTPNPYQLTAQVTQNLFSQMRADHAKIQQDPNYLKTVVKQNLMPYVHIKYAGSLVLGRALKTISKPDRNAFFTAFGDFVEQSYAQALTLYNGQKVDVEQAKPITQNLVTVRVDIIQTNGAAPIHLTFFWRKNSKTGQWQAYDMAVEGVSLVDTKRQEWSPILRRNGIQALIQQVQKAARAPITLGKK